MATGTHHILQHKPVPRGDYRMLWIALAAMALTVIAYAVYHGYNSEQAATEYESTTVMGSLLHESAFRA